MRAWGEVQPLLCRVSSAFESTRRHWRHEETDGARKTNVDDDEEFKKRAVWEGGWRVWLDTLRRALPLSHSPLAPPLSFFSCSYYLIQHADAYGCRATRAHGPLFRDRAYRSPSECLQLTSCYKFFLPGASAGSRLSIRRRLPRRLRCRPAVWRSDKSEENSCLIKRNQGAKRQKRRLVHEEKEKEKEKEQQ